MNFEELKEKNYEIIKKIKEKIELNSDDDDMKMQLKINNEIAQLLEKDEAVFFKMRMENAMKILAQIVQESDVEQIYMELVSPTSYEKLLEKLKI